MKIHRIVQSSNHSISKPDINHPFHWFYAAHFVLKAVNLLVKQKDYEYTKNSNS